MIETEKNVATGQGSDKKTDHPFQDDSETLRYNTVKSQNCQLLLADRLLDKINPAFADVFEYWWRILAAYRNSGGSLKRFQEWSRTVKYDVPKQVERAWYNCQLTAGLRTLAYYVKESGNPDIVQEVRKQHYGQMKAPSNRTPPIQKPVVDVVKARQMLIDPWGGADGATLEKELLTRSNPKPQGNSGAGDMLAVLPMFENEDILTFPQHTSDIGSDSRDTVAGWRNRLLSGEPPREFFIPNLHCGAMRQKHDGELSWRADACFTRRFVVIEFDSMPLADQLRLWLSLIDSDIRPTCLTFSGGKSIHAWIPASTATEVTIFFDCLLPLGADPHTKNVGRLSRTPGAIRKDKGTVQRLLYMNFEAAK